jgi:hypothetical protein
VVIKFFSTHNFNTGIAVEFPLKIIVMKTMARYSKFMREHTTNTHLILLAETCCSFLHTSRQEPGGTSPQVPRQLLLLHVMPSWLMSCPHQSIASPRWRESRSFADRTGSCVQSICRRLPLLRSQWKHALPCSLLFERHHHSTLEALRGPLLRHG